MDVYEHTITQVTNLFTFITGHRKLFACYNIVAYPREAYLQVCFLDTAPHSKEYDNFTSVKESKSGQFVNAKYYALLFK